MRLLALLVLCACGPTGTSTWTIDVSHIAEEHPGSMFVADLVRDGETVRREVMRFDEETRVVLEGAMALEVTYGIVAFVDLDDNDRCSLPPADLGWSSLYRPRTTDGFDWAPELELSDDISACDWFGLDEITLQDLVFTPQDGGEAP